MVFARLCNTLVIGLLIIGSLAFVLVPENVTAEEPKLVVIPEEYTHWFVYDDESIEFTSIGVPNIAPSDK